MFKLKILKISEGPINVPLKKEIIFRQLLHDSNLKELKKNPEQNQGF